MQNTAPKGGAGSDEPIGHDLGQVRPIGYLDRGIVRTSFSDARRIDSFPASRAPRSRSSSSWLSTVIGRCGAEATGGANAGRNQGRKRGLAPDPTGGAAPLVGLPRESGAVRGGAVRGRCCLDPRRLTVRRQPNGRVRLSVGSSSEGAVLCGAGWSR